MSEILFIFAFEMAKIGEISVTRTSLPPFEEYCEAIRPLWESHIVTNMGPLHEQFAAALRARWGLDGVTLFSHGHLALEAALEAVGGARNEVITTPFTFVSTVHAIVRRGFTPVFADVLPEDGTMDPASLETLISERTAAILPVHVYGNPCDVEAIDAIARRHGVPVIYDAAHAFDVYYKEIPLVRYGDASVLSFHATKVFSTVEGGAVCLSARDIAKAKGISLRLDDIKNFGIRDEETCVYPGGNGKMNELEAAMGLCNLRHIDEEIASRREAYKQYLEVLQPILAKPDAPVRLLRPRPGTRPNYAYLPLLLPNQASRDSLYTGMRAEGIHARKYFWPLVSDTDCYRSFALERPENAAGTPVAADLAARVLCLPLFAWLQRDDIVHIASVLRRHFCR